MRKNDTSKVVRYPRDNLPPDQTDWARVEAMTDDEVTVAARNREAAALYTWSPYMHDPKLKGRLHRIRIPTLVLRGTADRLVGEAYGGAFAAAVPGAKFETLAGAGHFPHIEQPKAFAERALAFAKANA